MATKRKRGERWEYTVKHRGLLPKPLYYSFFDEAEGDTFIAQLEALLNRGIIPEGLLAGAKISTIGDAIDNYILASAVSAADQVVLPLIKSEQGALKLTALTYQWAEAWIAQIKQKHRLAPVTIRHRVGALARCLDHSVRRGVIPVNPLRQLPRGYATYNAADTRAAGVRRVDHDRDRRLQPGEEERIRAVLNGERPPGRQRPFTLRNQESLLLLFDLALETAMRMREMFTLEGSQVDLPKRTIFLERTKNGDRRQVPLSTPAMAAVRRHGLPTEGPVFPWQGSVTSVTSRLSQQFRRIFAAAECPDLHFHDLRHEATSRFFERTTLGPLEIAKITGHRDFRMLDRYANLRGSDLAAKLW